MELLDRTAKPTTLFQIVDTPTVTLRRANGTYAALIETLKSLPEGKSIFVPLAEGDRIEALTRRMRSKLYQVFHHLSIHMSPNRDGLYVRLTQKAGK